VSFTAFGGVWVGAVNAKWYRYVDNALPATVGGLVGKVTATWVVLGIVGNSVNMCYQRLIKERDLGLACAYVRDNVVEVIVNDAKLWPLFDCVVFTIVPPAARTMCIILASLSWNTYINIASHRPTSVLLFDEDPPPPPLLAPSAD